MHAERDHLITVVFPELRERLELLGLDFFDVDLRWGVPDKDANGEEANSWEYCRQWIDRVEPFFVCILGQRYGSVPEPKDFKRDEDKIQQTLNPRSITDWEVRHAVLNDHKKRRSYFYLRETEISLSDSSDKLFINNVLEYVDSPEFLGRLKELKEKVKECGRPVRYYNCNWNGKNFTDFDKVEKKFGQMVLEDLWSGVLRDERYVKKEVWRQVLGSDPDTDILYIDESQPVPYEIWKKIVAIAKPEPNDQLVVERHQMEAFAASRLRWFQGRSETLQLISNFLHSTEINARRIAVISAEPGQGKTSLIAKIWESLMVTDHSAFVIAHFVGATEHSTDARSLVLRLLEELERSGIEWQEEKSLDAKIHEKMMLDINTLSFKLAKRLENYAGKRTIVLLIDALNQLSNGHNLSWLPHHFGPSVRVVVTCINNPLTNEDNAEQMILRALERRHPVYVTLEPLIPEDIRTIIEKYLAEYCKELDTPQIDAISKMPQAQNPLYLLVMLNELRALGGNDMNKIVRDRIEVMGQNYPDTISLFRWVLTGLEKAYGWNFVSLWCSYLALGRVGMASHELADLLNLKLGTDGTAQALRIERGLRRYLSRSESLIGYFHGELRKAVEVQYLSQESSREQVHTDMARYFRYRARPVHEKQWNINAVRPLSQVAYHQVLTGKVRMAEHLLCNLSYGAACAQAEVLDIFLNDMVLAKKLHSSSIDTLNDVILRVVHALRSRPDLFINLIVNELSGTTLPEPLRSCCDHSIMYLNTFGPWLQSLNSLRDGCLHWAYRIINVYPEQNLVYCVDDESGDLLICQLESQQVLTRYAGLGRFKTAIDPILGTIAIINQNKMLEVDGFSTNLALRTRTELLEFFGNGVIVIDNNDQLVWWNCSEEKSTILAKSIPKSFCKITFSLDGRSAVVLVGDRHDNQKVIILRKVENNIPSCQHWSSSEGTLTAACIESSGQFLVTATLRRDIIIVDLTNSTSVARISLANMTGRPLSSVIACAIKETNKHFHVIFADGDDSICFWNVKLGSVRRTGRYKSLRSSEGLLAIQWIEKENYFLISTYHSLIFSTSTENIESPFATAISSCSLGADGWITLATPLEHKIVWFNSVSYSQEFFYPFFTPRIVASSGNDGAIIVGADTNFIALTPGKEPASEDIFMLFDQPIVSIFCLDDASSVAVSANGEAKLVCFKPESVSILHEAEIHWNQLGACLISQTHGIAYWGRSISDSGKSRLFVIKKNETRETILECKELIHSVCAEPVLPEINVAVGNSVSSYRYDCGQWCLTASRLTAARHLASFGQDHLVVILNQDWIELWRRSDLVTISAAYVPEQITCVACSPPNIIVGTGMGYHLRLSLHSK